METIRGLSNEFMEDLSEKYLNPILNLLHRDHTLCLQIRNDYINIYYRGGNILKLTRKSNYYQAEFNEGYFKTLEGHASNIAPGSLPKQISTVDEANKWIQSIPLLKQQMDDFFSKLRKSEREHQQLVVKENNKSKISNDTDYFITDIEYTQKNNSSAQFDLIGIKWLSTSTSRKSTDNCRLAIIEMKYGDDALEGESGIQKHLMDVEKFCGDRNQLDLLKRETILTFKQMRKLGLVQFSKTGNNNEIEKLTNEKPEFIFIFANHKPSHSKLKEVLQSIQSVTNVDVKVATSSFMGYGLYNNNMLSVKRFLEML